MRSYVLVGFNDGPEGGWRRCNFVESFGVMPLPQWFHELDAIEHNIVTKDQAALGWDDGERTGIMRFFYKHTGIRKHAEIEVDRT